jgi:hypothetical protein
MKQFYEQLNKRGEYNLRKPTVDEEFEAKRSALKSKILSSTSSHSLNRMTGEHALYGEVKSPDVRLPQTHSPFKTPQTTIPGGLAPHRSHGNLTLALKPIEIEGNVIPIAEESKGSSPSKPH